MSDQEKKEPTAEDKAKAVEGVDKASDDKAKATAAAKAKAAAAAKAKAAAVARAKAVEAGKSEEDEKPKESSPNQPMLDDFVKVVTSHVGEEAIEQSYINELSKDAPTLIVAKDKWHQVASLLYENKELEFDYLSTLHGVDYEDRMEVVYSLLSFNNKGKRVTVKVKLDREKPELPSVTDIWNSANWHEREAYDLLGIFFEGHPDLRRILLPDDWVGYPLRKDYEQLDEEV